MSYLLSLSVLDFFCILLFIHSITFMVIQYRFMETMPIYEYIIRYGIFPPRVLFASFIGTVSIVYAPIVLFPVFVFFGIWSVVYLIWSSNE